MIAAQTSFAMAAELIGQGWVYSYAIAVVEWFCCVSM